MGHFVRSDYPRGTALHRRTNVAFITPVPPHRSAQYPSQRRNASLLHVPTMAESTEFLIESTIHHHDRCSMQCHAKRPALLGIPVSSTVITYLAEVPLS